MPHRSLLLCAVLCIAAGCKQTHAPSTTPSIRINVAAASDLTPAFTEIGSDLGPSRSIEVVFTFGSSGLLSKQIEQGAPFDVFASANREFVNRLESQGLVLPGSQQVFAQGRLVIWQRQDAATAVASLDDLATPAVRRIAIANPEHAPYGLAARQALESKNLWETVKGKIVFGENVAQAFQFAQTGNVDVAIVARSLSMRPQGRAVPVDPSAHLPIDQTLCILLRTKQPEASRRFVECLRSVEGRVVLQQYGFLIP